MSANEAQTCFKDPNSKDYSAFVSKLSTHAGFHTILLNWFDGVFPLIWYKHDEHESYHFYLLHKDLLFWTIVQQFLDSLSPFDGQATLLLIVGHHIVCTQLDHLLNPKNY